MNYYMLDHEATIEDIEKIDCTNKKLGVIAHIENDKNEFLLQLRGNNSSDEKGKYEYVGGKVEEDDTDFKKAIIREIKEEAGEDINLELSDSIGLFYCPKEDYNWIFVIYSFKYIDGNIKIMEPGKCQEYKFFNYEEALNSQEVSEGCKYLIDSIQKNYKQK